MRLLLIRHAQTPSNVAGSLDTARPGAALTPLGELQAEAIPAALAGEALAGIHVSPLLRTQLTAAPLAAATGLAPTVQEGLEEIAAGELEMRSDEEAVLAYRDCGAHWVRGALDEALPGGEDGRAFLARYEAALRSAVAGHRADETVAVVSHGAAIRVYAAIVGAVPVDELAGRPLRNTGMVTLTGHPDTGWRLTDWIDQPLGGAALSGDSSHDVTAKGAPAGR